MLMTEQEIKAQTTKDIRDAAHSARLVVEAMGPAKGVIFELEMIRLEIGQLRAQLASQWADQ